MIFFSAHTFWLFVVLYCRLRLSVSSILRLRAASMRYVSRSSASLIWRKSFLCFESSLFSWSSMASIWASSIAFPTRTCRMGSASNSKSKRSGSLSLIWMVLTSPSGFGTKMGEGCNKINAKQPYWSINIVVRLQLCLIDHVFIVTELIWKL